MSFLTWCGAAIGCALAHFQIYIVNVDVSALNNIKRPVFDFIRPVFANKINNFACTLCGALLGLLTEMTYNVSLPSLFMFLLYSLITNTSKFMSLRNGSESVSAEKSDSSKITLEENDLNLNTTVSRRASLNSVKTFVSSLAFWEKMELIAYISEKAGNEGNTSSTVPNAEGSLLGPASNEGFTSSTVPDSLTFPKTDPEGSTLGLIEEINQGNEEALICHEGDLDVTDTLNVTDTVTEKEVSSTQNSLRKRQ
jgi:hypothetical protein